MLNIFFISNDVRVARLIEYFQPRFKSKIRWADNFDHGLKEVFENRPALVFIQNSIHSVSGETVARHIKSLLGSASPKIVYLDETGPKLRKNAAWCDEWMRMPDSQLQFQDEFADLVARLYPDDWEEDINNAAGDLSNAASAVIAGAGGGEPERRLPHAADRALREEAGQPVQPELVPVTVNGPDGQGNVSVAPATDPEAAFPAAGAERRRRGRGRLGKALLLLVLAGAVAGLVYVLLMRENRVSLPSAPGTETAQTARPADEAGRELLRRKVREGLPSFIRSEWRDPAYSSRHPGWERYVSAEAEFRLFRNGGMMKALQIVAPEGRSLSEPYLASVFRALGYPVPARAGKALPKDGFLMEQGVLEGSAETVIYRESDGRTVRAFVMVFP